MQIGNAIAWAHLQLRGGLRNILLTAGGYAAIIGMLIFASLRLSPVAGGVLTAWTMAIFWLQILTLIPYGCWCVGAAIRKDVTNKMIESHRLMPVSGTDALVGYVIGPACQAIAVAAVNLVIGLLIVQGATGPMASTQNWIMANAVLGVFALCAWVVLAFLPLVMPVGSRVLVGMVWVLVVGHQGVAPLLPGVSLLFGPALHESVLGVLMTGKVPLGMQVSICAQLLVATLCFVGGVRKYRRDDVLAWGPVMGIVVVAAYVVISLAGLTLWPDIRPKLFYTERLDALIPLILSAVGAMVAGILPVSSAVWMNVAWKRRRGFNDPAPNPRPVSVLLVVIATSLVSAALLPAAIEGRLYIQKLLHATVSTPSGLEGLQTRMEPREMVVRTILVIFAFLLSMSFMLKIMYQSQRKLRWLAVIFGVSICLLPVVADFTVNGAMKHFESEKVWSEISGCSPVVAIIYIWTNIPGFADVHRPMNTNYGLAVQFVVAAMLGGLALRAARREQLVMGATVTVPAS